MSSFDGSVFLDHWLQTISSILQVWRRFQYFSFFPFTKWSGFEIFTLCCTNSLQYIQQALPAQLFSLHIHSMWETICDAWACWSGWKFGANSTEYPYSVIQNTPPPAPENWNLGRSWDFEYFQLQNTPPPPGLPNGKLCVVSYHMWRLYPTWITTRWLILIQPAGPDLMGNVHPVTDRFIWTALLPKKWKYGCSQFFNLSLAEWNKVKVAQSNFVPGSYTTGEARLKFKNVASRTYTCISR